MASAEGGEEGKKKDNRVAVVSDRIGTAISPMEREQILGDMSFPTKPPVREPLKEAINFWIRYPGFIGFSVMHWWQIGE